MRPGASFELRETSPGGRSSQLCIDGYALPFVKSVSFERGVGLVDEVTVKFHAAAFDVVRFSESWLDVREREARETIRKAFDVAHRAANDRFSRAMNEHIERNYPCTLPKSPGHISTTS